MTKYFYKAGHYPTTMQAMLTKFNEDLYNEIIINFNNKYSLNKQFNLEFSEEFNYCLNKTAFIIFNKDNQIVDYAFEEFIDFVWILQVNNIDNIEFEIPLVLEQKIQEELEQFSDRIIKLK